MVLCAERRVSWDTEFGPLVKGYSATCGNDDPKPCFVCCSAREVGNSSEVGFFEPGLDYCLGVQTLNSVSFWTYCTNIKYLFCLSLVCVEKGMGCQEAGPYLPSG